jgi:predicted esterase
MNDTQKNSPRSKNARDELERALSLHLQGNKTGALKSLRKALELDPSFSTDIYVSNLAKEITGLPAKDALHDLSDRSTSRELIHTAKKEQRRTPQARRQLGLLPILGLFLVVIVGLGIWVVRSGTLAQPQSQKASLGGYEYYLSVPGGSAPETGWPIVVVFHGYGGNGGQMMPLAETFNDAGAIFLAPSLGRYRPNPGKGPLQPAAEILAKVGREYPLQSRGAILLGHSQGGSFAYRFSVYYPNMVAGVVTAGAPEYDAVYPQKNMPYIFTWGELDEIHEYVLPMAYPIQNRGWNVRTVIVPGVGHELSQYAVDQTLILLQQP